MAKEPDLSLSLHEAGLDNVQFWLDNLAEYKKRSLASLKLMEGDVQFYKVLEKKAEHYVERKALAKLLKIDKTQISPTLEMYLHDNGFDDVQFWLANLKERNIVSLDSLMLMEGNIHFFTMLDKKAKYLVERKALAKMLRIDENQVLIRQDSPSLTSNAEEVLEYVQNWSKETIVPVEKVQEWLECIWKIKRNIVNPETRFTTWVKEYLMKSSMQEFLMSITKYKSDNSSLEATTQKIVDLEDLHYLSVQSFPRIKEFSNWLYSIRATKSMDISSEVVSLDSFESFLSDTILVEYAASQPRSCEALAKYISEEIYQLRFHIKETYDDVFLIILTYPFLKDSDINILELKPLTIHELQYLKSNFSEQSVVLQIYKSKKVLLLQAYLFLLAINSWSKHGDQELVLFLRKLFFKINDLQPPLDCKLAILLEQSFTSSKLKQLKQDLNDNLSTLKKKLENILIPPCQGRLKKYIELGDVCPDFALDRNLEIITKQYKALTLCEDEFSELGKNEEAHKLLETLGLCCFYPKKLKLQTALCIREEPMELSLNKKVVTNPKQLPFLVLHKLMSYDGLFRSDLIPALSHKSDYPASDSSDSDDESASECMNTESLVYNVCSLEIHPIDILLSLILISDDFLCQDLLSRLAKCQFSIPFVIPNPFTKELYVPIWAMNSILHGWESVKENKAVRYSGPIIKYPTPIISFIRIGKHHKYSPSKSKILNELISDSHHDYFFHRDCRGGQYKTILGQGLIDIAWYIPSGKTDIFTDAITFLNLHGDASNYTEQCQFLSKCSSMCIVLLTEEEPTLDNQLIVCLKEFYSSPGGVCILNCAEHYPKELEKIFSKPYVINLVSKNSIKTAAEIKDALQIRIKKKVRQMQECKCIETVMHQNRTKSIVTDKDSNFFQIGLFHANKIRDFINNSDSAAPENTSSLKDILLPLQGKGLWKAWASHDREIFRQTQKENVIVQEYTAQINDKMSKIRHNQLRHIANLNPLMSTFIESLIELGQEDSEIFINIFLQILKLEFNSLSRDQITEKQYEYQKKRQELSKLQNEPQSTNLKEEIVRLKQELETLQDKIIDASLGLEHLFRELGQIYEASIEGELNDDAKPLHDMLDHYISCLPKVVAQLVAEGYPLEIMDGDAAHIPLEWVTAVINEVVEILGDPRVFVLTILGLQSTGKSTMLNTTFGLQFNVSAGRCTRGAFMQLLPLDEDLKQATGCSYVIIVDTEGLRAPELDFQKTQNHDNELATFVIGLADMTLINIYGEVPGDIDDILQTSVHAFLRMTQVKYYPSCQFVHQNAGVNIKGEVGRAKFTTKLNKFTIAAAQEENCEGYEAFNDVIKFNDQTDVHYFPGLWKGDPPMAPVNQGYSQSAQSLKYHLVTALSNSESQDTTRLEEQKFHCLSSFQTKLNDLWNSLLKENFVFSFKNTLEITSYNSLETAYNKWEWSIQSAMLQWERQAENEISTEPPETLSEKVQIKLKELNIYINVTLCDPIKKKMEQFFKGEQSEILIQWKSKFEIRLKYLLHNVRSHAEYHCINLLKRKKVISDFEADMQINVEFIKKNVQQRIEKVRKEQQFLFKSIEKKEMSSDVLSKLVAKELFIPQQLSQFLVDKIIVPEQAKRILTMMSDNEGELNEHILEKILKEDVLTLDQVKKILIKTDRNEGKLWSMFNEIWKKLLDNLPRVQTVRGISIEVEVEKTLIKYLEGTKHQSEVMQKLKWTTLRERGLKLEVIIKPKHFSVNGILGKTSHQVQRLFGTTDQYEIQANENNILILEKVMQYLESKCKEDIDFNAVFIIELLQLIENSIKEYSDPSKYSIKFTPEYKLQVFMIVCGYAILQFEIMAKKFEDKSNPILYLEKHQKIPLFTKFKNQYKLTEAEEAIADTFCAYLEEPVTTQINKLLGAKLVDKMKASQHHQFSSKIALKVKILNDLHEEDIFSNYMLYIKDIRMCLQKRIKGYTIEYCNKEVGNHKKTLLQVTAEEEIIRLLDAVENIIGTTEAATVQDLLGTLCKDVNLRKEIGVDLQTNDLLAGYESLDELNVTSFKSKIIKRLKPLKETCQYHFKNIMCETAMDNWKDKPHDLLKNLIGCTAQCPFCGEQCDLLEHDDTCDHRTEVHRFSCLAGWRERSTRKMVTSICPILIASDRSFYISANSDDTHPYKDYKSIHPQWFIPPDIVAKSCSYWKWFVASHREELENEYDADGSYFLTQWSHIKWKSIKQDLKSVYKLNF